MTNEDWNFVAYAEIAVIIGVALMCGLIRVLGRLMEGKW